MDYLRRRGSVTSLSKPRAHHSAAHRDCVAVEGGSPSTGKGVEQQPQIAADTRRDGRPRRRRRHHRRAVGLRRAVAGRNRPDQRRDRAAPCARGGRAEGRETSEGRGPRRRDHVVARGVGNARIRAAAAAPSERRRGAVRTREIPKKKKTTGPTPSKTAASRTATASTNGATTTSGARSAPSTSRNLI